MPEGRGLFDVARDRIRTRHLSLRTEQAYLHWMRRYVKFHGRRHPRDLGPTDVEGFLTHLAVDARVGASTQNQALQALLFLYRRVLDIELPWLENVTRASRPKRLPVVLSKAEVHSVLAELDGACWLIASLLYGSGLRLMEAHRLRVKDIVIDRGEIIVRDAKGGKDRSRVNILMRQRRGAGSGCFPRTPLAETRIPACRRCIINMKRRCRGRSSMRFERPGSCSRRVAIPSDIALRRICSRPARIFAPCRNCWVTPT
jgi:integrase